MTSLEVCKLLNTYRVRALDYGFCGLISIFDDEHFSNSDYDILEPSVRADIRRILLNDGWNSIGGRAFEKESVQIKFPKPSHTLGCNPADNVLEAIKEGTYCIVTPTQALLASISLNEWNFEKAQKLVVYHPANLSKIWNWVSNENSTHVPREDIAALKELQRAGFELRKKGEQNLYPCKKLV